MLGAERSELFREVLAARYEMGTPLGSGGTATVFRARDRKHDRRVAVKVLRPEFAESIGVDRFLREIRVAAQLQHPHIVALFDSGEIGGVPYYVMPLVEGESLRQRLEREKQLGIEDAVRLVREVAGALRYAHEHGVIHRDIKPENILLQDGHALVADFGLAHAMNLSGAEKLTQSGFAVGTPRYMSPEQGVSGEVDTRSDVYSLGCVLYELLVGDPPFVGRDSRSIIARHAASMVPSLRDVRPGIPEGLERVVMRALEKMPADRFQSAAAFSQALDQLVASGSSRPILPETTPIGSVRRRHSRQFVLRVVTVASVIAVVGVLAAAALIRSRSPRDHASAAVERPAAAADALPPRTIAILYFDSPSKVDSLSVLGGAITEMLIERLRGGDSISVISQGGVRPFRGRHIAADSIARVLNAGTLIAGTLTPSGRTLRLDMTLIDGRTGAKILGASVGGSTERIFALLDNTAAELSRLLQRRLGLEVRLRALPVGTQNARAWEALQRVKQTIAGFDSVFATNGALVVLATSGAQQGLKLLASTDAELTRIAGMDARWAAPVVLRGFNDIRRASRIYDRDSIPRWLEAGGKDAEKALALAPNDPDALELRGTVRFFKWSYNLDRDPANRRKLLEQSEADLRAAILANPLQARAWAALSYVLGLRNKSREAATAARTAYALDPYDAVSSAKDVYRAFSNAFDAGDEFEARRWCELGGRRFPTNVRFAECRLMLFSLKGAKPKAEDLWSTFQELPKLSTMPPSQLNVLEAKWELYVALGLIRAGLPDSAKRVAMRARAGVAAWADPILELNYYEAVVRTWLGEKDEAFRLLREFSRKNPRLHVEEDDSWWLEDLRLDPRWQELRPATR